MNHYILKREIGRGSFGVVHLGVDSTTGEEFVLALVFWAGGVADYRRSKSFPSQSYGNDLSR